VTTPNPIIADLIRPWPQYAAGLRRTPEADARYLSLLAAAAARLDSFHVPRRRCSNPARWAIFPPLARSTRCDAHAEVVAATVQGAITSQAALRWLSTAADCFLPRWRCSSCTLGYFSFSAGWVACSAPHDARCGCAVAVGCSSAGARRGGGGGAPLFRVRPIAARLDTFHAVYMQPALPATGAWARFVNLRKEKKTERINSYATPTSAM
jgi:hypothetical protein